MRTRRRGGWAWSVAVFPAAGLAATGLAAGLPGSPVGPSRWPVRGPFGAFTWLAWFIATWLGLTLLSLAVALVFRPGRAAGRALLGRILPPALAFGLLSLASYVAAAHADRIARHPAVALTVAVASLIALRAVALRRRSRD